jgi:hypothetical protein
VTTGRFDWLITDFVNRVQGVKRAVVVADGPPLFGSPGLSRDQIDQLSAHAEGGYQLIIKPDDIVHMVCCRDTSWGTAFCGEPTSEEINVGAQHPCTMCIEQAEAMLPGSSTSEENRCPVDGNRCPDEHEINLRIARATDPT